MGTESDSEGGSSGRRLKVVRLIDDYDLHGLGEELERRWTADSDARMSLRDLADYVNRELLTTVVRQSGGEPMTGEIENMYELLTGTDVSNADRTRIRRHLENEGVDVERLETDFVTYQAVRAYLRDYRGTEYERSNRSRRETEIENVDRLRGRMSAVIESKLEQLNDTDKITLGEFNTIIRANVVCETCEARFGVTELIERGGCDCDPDEG